MNLLDNKYSDYLRYVADFFAERIEISGGIFVIEQIG